MLLTVTVFLPFIVVIQSQTDQPERTVRTSTLSSQHRLLSDLHERLNNLESSVLGVDDKKVTKLRNELAKQIDLMRNQVSYEVPHKMKLVADAVEMLRKYPVDSGTTMNAVTNDDTLSKVKRQEKKSRKARLKARKCTRWCDELSGMDEELRDEMIGSFLVNEHATSALHNCGILVTRAMPKEDRKRYDDYNRLLKEMRKAGCSSKKSK